MLRWHIVAAIKSDHNELETRVLDSTSALVSLGDVGRRKNKMELTRKGSANKRLSIAFTASPGLFLQYKQAAKSIARSPGQKNLNRMRDSTGGKNVLLINFGRLFRILCQRKNTRSIRSQIECSIKPAFKEDGQLR